MPERWSAVLRAVRFILYSKVINILNLLSDIFVYFLFLKVFVKVPCHVRTNNLFNFLLISF